MGIIRISIWVIGVINLLSPPRPSEYPSWYSSFPQPIQATAEPSSKRAAKAKYEAEMCNTFLGAVEVAQLSQDRTIVP